MTDAISSVASVPLRSPSVWRLALRSLWRDLRAGELRVLFLAVALAVAALSAVGFFADRLDAGLQRDAAQLLGGDAVLVSDNPPPPEFAQQGQALGLRTVQTLSFPTMARADDAQGGVSRLVALKGVAAGYPLRGTLTVQRRAQAPEQPAAGIPPRGEVWADAAVFESLGLQPGDALWLGDLKLHATALIANEPDRGAGFLNFAPRVMLNDLDVAASGLIQPASRVTYRLAVAGESGAVRRYAAWVQQALQGPQGRGMRLESLESGRPEMRQTLDRAGKFLKVVALLAALLSAVAVALSARDFANRHLDDCAMLRVLGLRQRTLAASYAIEFGLASLAASAIGLALGYGVHWLFVRLLAGLVAVDLPLPGLWPLGFGLGVGLTLLVAFGLPPVLQLAQVPALRVLRRDLGALRPASAAVLLLGVAGFATLLLAASADRMLGLIAVGGFAVAVALFAALAYAAIRLLRASVRESVAPRWMVLATRQITARPASTVVQVSSLGVGLLALVLLVLLRTDLVSSWRAATPPDAPNRFVINVQPEQAAAFRQSLTEALVRNYDWYPMVRGRLVAINGRAVTPEQFTEERARRLVDREFNLSHTATQPPHNQIVAGRWTPGEAGAISVEEGLAQTLGLKLGDVMRFDIAGQLSEARITSLRKVDWGSMHANFFVIYPVDTLADVPETFLAAFRAPATAGFDNALVRRYPNITLVDMSATIAQVQRVLNQVIGAVEFLFAFTLAAGLVVLFAAISASREERLHAFAILRAIGARSALLRQVQRAELAGVGLLAGFLAGAVAWGVGWALATQVFGFAWTAPPWVPVASAAVGALLALAAGYFGLRDVLRQSVVHTLRRAVS